MAFDETMAQKIREILVDKGANFFEKKMFSGICFMVDDKMCCATHIDKNSGENLVLCRIGEEAYPEAIEKDECIPMNFTGKSMKGYVYVTENGTRNHRDLVNWIQKCLDYNPLAKKSKK
jgi:hypothetical protein